MASYFEWLLRAAEPRAPLVEDADPILYVGEPDDNEYITWHPLEKTSVHELGPPYEEISRHLATLGIAPNGAHADAPVDDRVWRRIEDQAQARIPDTLRWMLTRYAGCGFPEGAFYADPRCRVDVMVGWILDGAELLAAFQDTRDVLPSDVVPISDDGGDNHLAVGIGPANSGGVYFHVHDAPIGQHLYKISESIECFLLSLHSDMPTR